MQDAIPVVFCRRTVQKILGSTWWGFMVMHADFLDHFPVSFRLWCNSRVRTLWPRRERPLTHLPLPQNPSQRPVPLIGLFRSLFYVQSSSAGWRWCVCFHWGASLPQRLVFTEKECHYGPFPEPITGASGMNVTVHHLQPSFRQLLVKGRTFHCLTASQDRVMPRQSHFPWSWERSPVIALNFPGSQTVDY